MQQGTAVMPAEITLAGLLAPSLTSGQNAFVETPARPRSGQPSPDPTSAAILALLSGTVPTAPKRPVYLQDWARANFGNELQKPFWTIVDAVPILLGIDPKFAPPDELHRNELDDVVAYEAVRLRQLVSDAQSWGDLGPRFRPTVCINWALKQHIYVPPALLKLAVQRRLAIVGYPSPLEVQAAAHRDDMAYACEIIRDRNDTIATLEAQVADLLGQVVELNVELEASRAAAASASETSPASSKLSGVTKSYNKACVLLCVLARVKFRIEFSASKQPSLAKMVSALSEAGVVIDDETLRKYLLNGAEQLARQAISPS